MLKATLRRSFRQCRDQLPAADRRAEQRALTAAVQELIGRLKPRLILGYVATASECDLGELYQWCWDRQQALALPRVEAPGCMQFFQVTSSGQLQPGFRGIAEPDPEGCPPVSLTETVQLLTLVPGLAFGPEGRRLGQGGGYYDRVLGQVGTSVGVGFSLQWCLDLPEEAHDRRVDGVLLGGSWRYQGKPLTRL